MFKPLVETTAQNFTVKSVPADKAYLSHENLELVKRLGGTAFIPYKINSVQGEAGSVWENPTSTTCCTRSAPIARRREKGGGE